jgi:hypothetical protein
MVGFNGIIILHLILDMFTWLRNSLVELRRLMIGCVNSRFVAFQLSRMVFFNGRTTASDDGMEWFALRRIYFFNGRIIASDDGGMRRGNKELEETHSFLLSSYLNSSSPLSSLHLS